MSDQPEEVVVEVLLRIQGSRITNYVTEVAVPNATLPLTEEDTNAAPEATVKLELNIPNLLREAADRVQAVMDA